MTILGYNIQEKEGKNTALFSYFFCQISLLAFKTANKVTPVSAKTAIQILANPNMPSNITTTLMPIERYTFCQTTLLMRLVSAMAVAKSIGLSV